MNATPLRVREAQTAASSGSVLETSRLSLCPLREVHLEPLKRILREPDMIKGMLGDLSSPGRLDLAARSWLSGAFFQRGDGFGLRGVFDRDGVAGAAGALLGAVGADPPPRAGADPEVYYFLARRAWGRGVASEAMSALCGHLFRTVGVPAVEALVLAELNPGSARVAEKLGMRRVGRVAIVGHHLDRLGALEAMAFDARRVRAAPREHALDTLTEAAFLAGQLLGEGVGDRRAQARALAEAGRVAGLPDLITDRGLIELIEQRIAGGMAAPGFAHYRISSREWRSRADRKAR